MTDALRTACTPKTGIETKDGSRSLGVFTLWATSDPVASLSLIGDLSFFSQLVGGVVKLQ